MNATLKRLVAVVDAALAMLIFTTLRHADDL